VSHNWGLAGRVLKVILKSIGPVSSLFNSKDNTMKTCATCKEQLPIEAFGNLKDTKDGLARRCKTCLNESNRASKARRPEGHKAQQRVSWLLRNYGITVEDYDKMVVSQGDRCGCCGKSDKGYRRGYWCVDHCHTTMRVRGLLCGSCNKAIGQLGDTKEGVQKALDYLTL